MLFTALSLTLATATTLAAPVPATPATAKLEAELVLGSAIVNRQPQPLPATIVAGNILNAFTEIKAPGFNDLFLQFPTRSLAEQFQAASIARRRMGLPSSAALAPSPRHVANPSA